MALRQGHFYLIRACSDRLRNLDYLTALVRSDYEFAPISRLIMQKLVLQARPEPNRQRIGC